MPKARKSDIKLVLIGGGSYGWTYRFVTDIACIRELDGMHIILQDINPDPLKLVKPLCDKICKIKRVNLRIETTRPEKLARGSTAMEGTVEHVAALGPLVKLRVAVKEQRELSVSLGKKEYADRRVEVGDHVHLSVAPEHVHVMQEGPLAMSNEDPNELLP